MHSYDSEENKLKLIHLQSEKIGLQHIKNLLAAFELPCVDLLYINFTRPLNVTLSLDENNKKVTISFLNGDPDEVISLHEFKYLISSLVVG